MLDGGLRLSLAHPFFPAPISCHIILSFLLRSCLPQSCQASLGRPFILLPMAQYGHWFFYFIIGGLLCPICFFFSGVLGPFDFLGLPWPLSLHFHELLLSSLGFSSPITLFLILGAHGIAINPLLSCFHYFGPTVTHSHFFTSYTAHGLLFFFFSFFPSSFKPIYPLKAHLFILWVCDPLFLPLGLNEFSIHLPNIFCLRCWAFPFHLDFQNGHQQCD